MSLLPVTASTAGFAAPPAARARRLGALLLPLLLLLLWTAAVRLPFYWQTDKDEFFFAVIAGEWLRGGLPYVATFDVKPPGIFFLYAVTQSLFGASQLTIKLMEVVAVALGGWALYGLALANGTRRVALWSAILFPVYSLSLSGAIAVSMNVQLPFVIAAFAAALAAVREDTEMRPRLVMALLAGLAMGGAGLIRQTAIFEATAVFAILCLWGGRGNAGRLAALFVVGAAIPVAAFALYFLVEGAFPAMMQDVVSLAMERTAPDVLASYGAGAAYYFTFLGSIDNVLSPSAPLLFLWAGALLAAIRWHRVVGEFPARLLVASAIWLAAALAGVFVSRGLCTYYLLALVPPLLVLAGAFYCHGLDLPARHRTAAFSLTIILAIAALAFIDHRGLFAPSAFLAGDHEATGALSAKLVELGLAPGDTLLVLNRGVEAYVETGAVPATPYFHPTQILGMFHTPVADTLGTALAGNARFVVYADPTVRHITEVAARHDQAAAYLAAHYREVARIVGEKDSFTIYRFAG